MKIKEQVPWKNATTFPTIKMLKTFPHRSGLSPLPPWMGIEQPRLKQPSVLSGSLYSHDQDPLGNKALDLFTLLRHSSCVALPACHHCL